MFNKVLETKLHFSNTGLKIFSEKTVLVVLGEWKNEKPRINLKYY